MYMRLHEGTRVHTGRSPTENTIPDVVLTQFDLLMMSTELLETCRGLRVSYQLDANIVYFSSTCFGPIRPSSGAIEFIIFFTNAAYGVLGAARCLEECVCWW